MTDIQRAQELLRSSASKDLYRRILGLVADNQAEWRVDPQVPGVVGVLRPGTNQALLVVYLDEADFEESDDLWDPAM